MIINKKDDSSKNVIPNTGEPLQYIDEENEKIIINYPTINGIEDEKLLNKVNSSIEIDAKNILNKYGEFKKLDDLRIKYKITLLDDNFISVQYTGTAFVEGGAHSDLIFYTTNIDLKSGEKLKISDVINLDSSFIDLINNGEFTPLVPEQASEVDLSKITVDNLRNGDSLELVNYEDNSGFYFYLTENSLGISIPVVFSLGGYSLFELDYSKLSVDMLKDKRIIK